MKNFKLDTHKKIEAGFTTPDFYFENASKKILEQLHKEEPKVISFWAKNKNWMYAAAAILVVSFSIPMMNLMSSNSEDAKATEIENYITYHSNLTDEEIAEYLDESDINNIDIESTLETETIEQVLYDEVDLEHQITN